MRDVKYTGEDQHIGRFGNVVKGQRLNLTEGEWRCVKDDKRYKLIGGTVDDGERRLSPLVLPFGTSAFDLRTIPWESPNVSDRLCARASRRHLQSVAEAMEFVGVALPPIDFNDDKIFIVDAIITAALNAGWDKLGDGPRLRLPVVVAGKNGKAKVPDVSLDEAMAESLSASAYRNEGDAPRRRTIIKTVEPEKQEKPEKPKLRKRSAAVPA